jgi:hypothetical protein
MVVPMKAILVLLSLVAAAPVGAEEPHLFLVSVEGITLGRDEQITGFAFETWGVTPKAVCHIPDSWTIQAGRRTNPGGVLAGHGSNGISWFSEGSPSELRDLVLIEFYGPMQVDDIRTADGSGVHPATFKGHADISTDGDDRQEPLTTRNIRLTPAEACPR